MKFDYHSVEGWPSLAWRARCDPGCGTVEVWHGSRVETRTDWFCEAVWDGAFDAGDFDRTDIVFGSGARLRDDHVVFVAPTTTVDRLQYFQWGDSLYVSNSMACLLAAVEVELDPLYTNYMMAIRSVVRGLEHYQRQLPTTHGSKVHVSYAENICWDGSRLALEKKPWRERDFRTFSNYVGFLDAAIGRLGRNLAAAERENPYRMLGTLSSGYDSATVATLARDHGMREAITFREGRPSHPNEPAPPSDSGEAIGELLGLHVVAARRDAWKANAMAPVLFLAGDANGQEVLFAGAEAHLGGSVLFTGMSGDTVWGKEEKGGPGLLARGDQSGLSVTEYRLHAGFIHVPVPFMGANQARDVRALSLSDQMAPWRLGGSYDRPICRRVLEEAGVPREVFGVRKVAASVRFSLRSTFWSSGFHEDLEAWLASHRGLWLRRGRVPPHWIGGLARPWQTISNSLVRGALRVFGRRARSMTAIRALEYLGTRELRYKYVFPWAVGRIRSIYLEALSARAGQEVGGLDDGDSPTPAGGRGSEGAQDSAPSTARSVTSLG
jgi:hypothetical protein